MSIGFQQSANSLLHCLNKDGKVDIILYTRFRHNQDEEESEDLETFQSILRQINLEEGLVDENETCKQPKKRAKSCVLEYMVDGIRKPCPPEHSPWYLQFLSLGKETLQSKRSLKKFRQQFRLPYDSYWKLLDLILAHPKHFKRYLGGNSKPIELLLLGTLRYLGRGWMFDDLEGTTGISRDVHRTFFHTFIAFGRTTLYSKYVRRPTLQEIISYHTREYNLAGLHGSIGYTDGVHIMCEKIPQAVRNQHLGHKIKHTSRSYNVTTNHRRFILATTWGHPATYNDKTLVRFDDFVQGIHRGELYEDMKFDLFEKSGNGTVIQQSYKGCWIICDNGYLKWSTTIPPMGMSTHRPTIRWSEWLESMRKDVEWYVLLYNLQHKTWQT
jgi:hypothetical protein